MDSLLPSIGELIGLIYSWGQPLFNALTPFTWYLVGIPLVFIFAGFIINLIQNKFDDWLDWREEKRDLEDLQSGFQNAFGSRTGAMMFERFRSLSDISNKDIDPLDFVIPDNMKSGESINDYMRSTTEKYQGLGYSRWNDPLGQRLNPNDFRSSGGVKNWLINKGRGIRQNNALVREKWNKLAEDAGI